MSEKTTQQRGWHGHFLPKNDDIQKKDVDRAIRMITEEHADISMRIKKPVRVNANLDASVHVYHHVENDECFFKVSMAVLAITAAIFLLWWMVIR